MTNVLLIKYGEIALRGKNRGRYENNLINTIKKALPPEYVVFKEQGRFVAECPGGVDFDEVIPRVLPIFGLVGIAPAMKLARAEYDNLSESAAEHMKTLASGFKTFKVVTKRGDKAYPLTSTQVSAMVGEFLLDVFPQLSVKMIDPELVITIELRSDIYIYSTSIKCFGGLPVGSSGKGMLLLSGGIDSPVAGFLAAKRGVELEAVYFNSPPYTSERAREKVVQLAKKLAGFTGGIKLYVIPFTDIQVYLYEHVPLSRLTILLKRAMHQISEKLADESKCNCLINGDSIGQVASQTLQSINAISTGIEMPIIRPLAGMDKQEIIDLAMKIGTYETSILPYEDCCTVFVSNTPETRPKTSVIVGIEKKLTELPLLIEQAIAAAEIINI